MDENLKEGEVLVIYDDYLSKTASKTKIQLADNIAIIYELNKTTNSVDMSVVNTLIDDLEYGGKISKSGMEKILKAQKDMFRQLT